MLCTFALLCQSNRSMRIVNKIHLNKMSVFNSKQRNARLHRYSSLHIYYPVSRISSSTLLTSVRYERSTSSRIRNSTWKEKTEYYDKIQQEVINSNAAAKRREQRRRSLFAAREAAKVSHAEELHKLHDRNARSNAAHNEELESLRLECEDVSSSSNNNSNIDDDNTISKKPRRRGTVWPHQLEWLRRRVSHAITSRESSPENVFNIHHTPSSADNNREVIYRLLGLFKIRRMPLNPLHKKTPLGENKDASKLNPHERINVKLITALRKYHLKRQSTVTSAKGSIHSSAFRNKTMWKEEMQNKNPMYTLTEEQQQEFVKAYARTKWYGVFFLPFAKWTGSQVKQIRIIAGGGIVLMLVIFLAMSVYMYYIELSIFLKLSREDQRDYLHLVMGMRYSDLYNAWQEERAKEDPLHALPLVAQCHELIEACRRKGWHKVDWSVELKKMHPLSALEERDFTHIMYWIIMYIGRYSTGSGAFFESRFPPLKELEQERKTRERYVQFAGDDREIGNELHSPQSNTITKDSTIHNDEDNEMNDLLLMEQLPQPRHIAEKNTGTFYNSLVNFLGRESKLETNLESIRKRA